MRLEKDGFVLSLLGTWMEISNKYGVQKYGDVAVKAEDIPDGFVEEVFDRFITDHTVSDNNREGCIKRVAYDASKGGYYQLQAIKDTKRNAWIVQKYDSDLVFIEEDIEPAMGNYEMLKKMRETYDVQRCLKAQVFRNTLTDCTNGGISKDRSSLYILSDQKGPFEPQDIRECVYIARRVTKGEEHTCCKPEYLRGLWYMAGGNFLYSTDSRFKEITKSKYPIPIFDRCEKNI